MSIDKEKLKALAQAVADLEDIPEREDEHAEAVDALWLNVHCHTILALLAEIESLEADSRDAKDAKVGLGWAVNELRSSFKNFHRSLCARFGYTHDEKDWFRDQVSLEEHVAGQIDQLKAENEALRKAVAGKVVCDLDLFEDLRDSAASEADEHRQHMAAYRPQRQEVLDWTVKRCDLLLAAAKEASHD